ncbi:hypothetical protein ABIE67_009107 [Streptomyces sp. V4I8]|uniref:hypothetical protein n=1 Tax=Streptomyces sp. V4I8 TaxID=3156469 RepID=UPI0035150981
MKAVQRRVGPASAGPSLQRDKHAWLHRIDQMMVEGLARNFALADARPELLRGAGPGPIT